eukprot:PhM_4_TR7553/c0_g1_i1/m.4407
MTMTFSFPRRRFSMSVVSLWLLCIFALASVCVAQNATVTPAPGRESQKMTDEAYVVVVLMVAMIVVLLLDICSATTALIITSVIFNLSEIITTADVFAGLTNNGVLAIAIMFTIVHPVADLPAARAIFTRVVLPRHEGDRIWPMLKLFVFSAFVSVWLENVPHVALMTPIVVRLTREFRLPTAQFLFPMSCIIAMSNGSILGSASNLIVEGLMADHGHEFPFFEMIKTCGPTTVIMILYVMVMAPLQLSDKVQEMPDNPEAGLTRFRFALRYQSDKPKTVGTLFSQLPDTVANSIKVIEVRHDDSVLPGETDTPINKGDRIVVCGAVGNVRSVRRILHLDWVAMVPDILMSNDDAVVGQELCPIPTTTRTAAEEEITTAAEKTTIAENGKSNEPIEDTPEPPRRNLSAVPIPIAEDIKDVVFVEVIVSGNVPGIGEVLQSGTFQRAVYASVMCAIPCSDQATALCGMQLEGHVLHEGDTLLLRASPDFVSRFRHDRRMFYTFFEHGHKMVDVVATKYMPVPRWLGIGKPIHREQGRFIKLPEWYPNLSFLVFLGVTAAAIAEVPLSRCAIVGACAMVILRLMDTKHALHSIDANAYTAAAFSFGIGYAMTRSKLAQVIGDALIDASVDGFPLLLLLGFITTIIASVVTNRTAVQVVMPIVFVIFKALDKDPMPGVVVVSNAAMGAFLTPFGLTLNLIVMGPGRYSAMDYLKFGGPLAVVYTLVHCLFAALIYDFW